MDETKYDAGFSLSALNFAEKGLTDAQIAYRLNISHSSFYNYKQQYPEFAEAIERGRDILDGIINSSLLELAIGDYFIITTVSDSEGRTRTTTKKAAPNLKAIQYWLERSDKRKGAMLAPPCGSRECGIEKLEEQEIQVEQPQTKKLSVSSAPSVVNADLDFSEIAGLQALAEYMAMCPADAGDGFSKKETQEFEDMMLITFTEMERRKYNEKAAAEGRPQIPYTDAAPRTLKGKYAPDMIKAAKDRADYFALAV